MSEGGNGIMLLAYGIGLPMSEVGRGGRGGNGLKLRMRIEGGGVVSLKKDDDDSESMVGLDGLKKIAGKDLTLRRSADITLRSEDERKKKLKAIIEQVTRYCLVT